MKLLSALLWSSLLATMAPSAWAQANTIPSQPHLLVKGEGARTVMPDRFTVELLVKSTDLQPDTARSRVQGNVDAVLGAFKRNHALPASVVADNLTIQPDYRYSVQGKQEYLGTRVSRRLKGSFGTTGDLQAFLRAVDASDDLQISSMRPGYSKEAALRGELKAEAATQTRASAKHLATAYGARITGLYSISDVAPNFAYGVQAGNWPRSGDLVTPPSPPSPEAPMNSIETTGSRLSESIEAGPITYTENVYAIFLISDGT
ncbi:putative secreted protein [Stenotrophomonas sp. RIT309]|uniref:SIMPL domain-containing protein n=1 Tax=Stenotrophomonas TaxID=40323 RepID=UPI000445F212|nr:MULTISPECIES: SIMPL domain-containing protein [Stenotrophomonas]EZP44873.1 putative secreted protein [Stenotrophomonas sp. RIT309]WGV53216.1 SIMPL domain-containing protein [Stenotrophomonas indicatrix]